MFGYVNVYKDLLRVCDYNVFRGYYCGLCKQLGKQFNQLTRIGLSYDMTFLAILISSLEEKSIDIKGEICIVHPLSKRPVVRTDRGIEYSADMSVILTYLKLHDDWQDEKKLSSTMRIFYWRSYKKTVKKYKRQSAVIGESLEMLSNLEKEGCNSVDKAADCFGRLLGSIFDINGDNDRLNRLGFLVGRFIYTVDAYKDIDDDIKHNSYNPFVCLLGKDFDRSELKKNISSALTVLLTDISEAYKFIDIKKNSELLDNIIYLGMRKTAQTL